MMLRRREDWPERLAALVEARRGAPFVWGSHDCALFAADAVLAMTDHDPAADVRSGYDDARTAKNLAAFAGGLEALADGRLGETVPPALARRGDVLLVEHDAGQSMAVCLGGVAAAPGADGLMFLPPSAWRSAWRVG